MDKVSALRLPGSHNTEYQFLIDDDTIQYCFALSKMTIIDDNMQESHYFKLKFVEMFECLARIACLAELVEHDKATQHMEKTEEDGAEKRKIKLYQR